MSATPPPRHQAAVRVCVCVCVCVCVYDPGLEWRARDRIHRVCFFQCIHLLSPTIGLGIKPCCCHRTLRLGEEERVGRCNVHTLYIHSRVKKTLPFGADGGTLEHSLVGSGEKKTILAQDSMEPPLSSSSSKARTPQRARTWGMRRPLLTRRHRRRHRRSHPLTITIAITITIIMITTLITIPGLTMHWCVSSPTTRSWSRISSKWADEGVGSAGMSCRKADKGSEWENGGIHG